MAERAVWIGPALLVGLWAVGTREDRGRRSHHLVFAAALASVIPAPRPFVDDDAFNYLHHAADGGFPSDHTTFALAFGLLRWRPPSWPRAWFALLAVGASVGWARVFLGRTMLSMSSAVPQPVWSRCM